MLYATEFPRSTGKELAHCFLALLISLLCLTYGNGFARQPDTDTQGRPLYYQGMLVRRQLQ